MCISLSVLVVGALEGPHYLDGDSESCTWTNKKTLIKVFTHHCVDSVLGLQFKPPLYIRGISIQGIPPL